MIYLFSIKKKKRKKRLTALELRLPEERPLLISVDKISSGSNCFNISPNSLKTV